MPITIWDAHEKSLEEIAEFLNEKIKKAKTKTDKHFEKHTEIFKLIPTFLMQIIFHIICYVSANLEIPLPMFGTSPDKFGHCLISNVGTLDMDMAFAPLCSPMFAMIVACMGKI